MALSNAERQARWRQKRAEEMATLRRAAKDGRLRNDAKTTTRELEKRIRQLWGELASERAKATREALLAENDELKRQLKGKNTEVANLKRKLDLEVRKAKARGLFMTKSQHHSMLSVLHPDRAPNDPAMQKRLEKAFQVFTALKIVIEE